MSMTDYNAPEGPGYDPYATGSLSGPPNATSSGPSSSSPAGGDAAASNITPSADASAPVYTDPYAISTTPTSVTMPSTTAAPASEGTEETSTWPYLAPVTGAYSTGPSGFFGAGRERGRMHSGGDWSAAEDSPVVATVGGAVVGVHYDANRGGYGHYADVLSDDGNIFRYAAHKEITVTAGQRVERGDQVGVVGTAPGGSFSHLHLEVIPPTSSAFETANAGEGGGTSWFRGRAPTLDQEPFFGVSRNLTVVAGKPIDPNARRDPNAAFAGNPFGFGRKDKVVASDVPDPGARPDITSPAYGALGARSGVPEPLPTIALGGLVNEDHVTLERGAQGEAVVELQNFLNMRGFDLEPDGNFGRRTREAVKTYQRMAQIEVDGKVGPETFHAISYDINPALAYMPGKAAYDEGQRAADRIIDPAREARTKDDAFEGAPPRVEVDIPLPRPRPAGEARTKDDTLALPPPRVEVDIPLPRSRPLRQALLEARTKDDALVLTEAGIDPEPLSPEERTTIRRDLDEMYTRYIQKRDAEETAKLATRQRFLAPFEPKDKFRPRDMRRAESDPILIRTGEAIREFARGVGDSYRRVLDERRLADQHRLLTEGLVSEPGKVTETERAKLYTDLENLERIKADKLMNLPRRKEGRGEVDADGVYPQIRSNPVDALLRVQGTPADTMTGVHVFGYVAQRQMFYQSRLRSDPNLLGEDRARLKERPQRFDNQLEYYRGGSSYKSPVKRMGFPTDV